MYLLLLLLLKEYNVCERHNERMMRNVTNIQNIKISKKKKKNSVPSTLPQSQFPFQVAIVTSLK
jgi:hypothetical protein